MVVKSNEEKLQERVAELESRLEIDCQWRSDPNDPENFIREIIPPEERDNQIDGIYARDCTIKLCEENIEKLKVKLQNALDKLGEVLYFTMGLPEDERCAAINNAVKFYNVMRPDKKIVDDQLIQPSWRSRALKLEEALLPFAKIPPVRAGSEDCSYEAVCYWTVIGHPNKCHFTKDDLERARLALGYEPAAVDANELKTLVRDDGYICSECARKNGAVWPEGHVATFHEGKCYTCKQQKVLCAVSDWSWPNIRGPKAPREL
jgi:hypothetical protein